MENKEGTTTAPPGFISDDTTTSIVVRSNRSIRFNRGNSTQTLTGSQQLRTWVAIEHGRRRRRRFINDPAGRRVFHGIGRLLFFYISTRPAAQARPPARCFTRHNSTIRAGRVVRAPFFPLYTTGHDTDSCSVAPSVGQRT